MPLKKGRTPTQSLLIRLGGLGGMIFGLSQGVLGPIEKAMNCSDAGICAPGEESISAADILLPMGLWVFGGLGLGLVLAMVVGHFARTL